MRLGRKIGFINPDRRLFGLYRRLKNLESALEKRLQAHEQNLRRALGDYGSPRENREDFQ